jgi:hypothetical protein
MFEIAGINTGVIRKRRVAAGEGMVTPAREVTVTYQDGRKEELIPGRTRFDPSHTLVRQRPELFTLCAKRDRTSAPATFRAMLARAEREVRRELEDPRALEQATRSARPRARTYGRHQLKPRRPTRAKLR